MAGLLYEYTGLSNEVSIFVARFWRNFYRSLLTHALRKGLVKLFVFLLFVPVICRAQAHPAEHLNLVIALDLSSSVDARGHDGKTEFEKNLCWRSLASSQRYPLVREFSGQRLRRVRNNCRIVTRMSLMACDMAW